MNEEKIINTTIAEFRKNMKSMLDQLEDGDKAICLTNRKKSTSCIIPWDQYELLLTGYNQWLKKS